jgi:hypothetical protein
LDGQKKRRTAWLRRRRSGETEEEMEAGRDKR